MRAEPQEEARHVFPLYLAGTRGPELTSRASRVQGWGLALGQRSSACLALVSNPSNHGEDQHHRGVGVLQACRVSRHAPDQVSSDPRTYAATYVRAQSHRGDSGGDQATRRAPRGTQGVTSVSNGWLPPAVTLASNVTWAP